MSYKQGLLDYMVLSVNNLRLPCIVSMTEGRQAFLLMACTGTVNDKRMYLATWPADGVRSAGSRGAALCFILVTRR